MDYKCNYLQQYLFYRYSKNKIFKVVEDNYVILECLKNNETLSYILQYNLEDQNKLFGCMTILSSISPVSLIKLFHSYI